MSVNTLVDLLDVAAGAHATTDAVSIHAGLRDRPWTYERLRRSAGAVAWYLRKGLGLSPGTRVVVWGPNCPQLVAAYFGIMQARLVLVPLDPSSTADFLAQVVKSTDAGALITGFATPTTPSVPSLRLEDLPFVADGAAPHDRPAAGDVAEVVFTSGTTGRPKGVVLTHRNIVSNVESARHLVPQRGYEVLSLLPLSHMLEQTVGLYVPMLFGSTIHYTLSRQAPVLIKALQRYGVTSLVVVPQVLELMMHGIEREVRRAGKEKQWQRAHRLATSLSFPTRRRLFRSVHRRLGGDLEFVICGGAKLPTQLEEAWERIGVRVIQGYGTTECSPIVAGNTYWSRVPGTVGRPVPGVRVRLSADGEVLVAGPNVFGGYWNDPVATAAVFDDDGWYHTGDLAAFDSAGRLSVNGRLGELIVLPSGLNVHPVDVERELRAESAIDDCVVLPLPDARGNASVHAAVIPSQRGDSEAATHDQIRQAISTASSRLAPHQRVTGFTTWSGSDFPRTNLLKVKRHEVLEVLTSRSRPVSTAPRSASVDGGIPDVLRCRLAAISGADPVTITPTTDLGLDLGFDSLARVELTVSLEDELGISLEEGDLASVDTVEQLATLLEQRTGAPPASFPSWPLGPGAAAIRSFIQQAVLFPSIDLVTHPFSVEGVEHLDGLAPPFLLIANHASHLDTPVILHALPPDLRRRTAVAAATDYFYSTAARGVAVTLALNTFPFSREGAVRSSLEHCGYLMDRGWSVLVYPEGTRSTTGAMGSFRNGVGVLATGLEAPIVPMAVMGTYEALPKGSTRPKRHPITVRIGAPLVASPDDDRPATARRLEEAVEALLHPARVTDEAAA